jgi:hypothetical protein
MTLNSNNGKLTTFKNKVNLRLSIKLFKTHRLTNKLKALVYTDWPLVTTYFEKVF